MLTYLQSLDQKFLTGEQIFVRGAKPKLDTYQNNYIKKAYSGGGVDYPNLKDSQSIAEDNIILGILSESVRQQMDALASIMGGRPYDETIRLAEEDNVVNKHLQRLKIRLDGTMQSILMRQDHVLLSKDNEVIHANQLKMDMLEICKNEAVERLSGVEKALGQNPNNSLAFNTAERGIDYLRSKMKDSFGKLISSYSKKKKGTFKEEIAEITSNLRDHEKRFLRPWDEQINSPGSFHDIPGILRTFMIETHEYIINSDALFTIAPRGSNGPVLFLNGENEGKIANGWNEFLSLHDINPEDKYANIFKEVLENPNKENANIIIGNKSYFLATRPTIISGGTGWQYTAMPISEKVIKDAMGFSSVERALFPLLRDDLFEYQRNTTIERPSAQELLLIKTQLESDLNYIIRGESDKVEMFRENQNGKGDHSFLYVSERR